MELAFLDALPLAPEAKQQLATILLGLLVAAGLLFGARLVAGVIKGTLRWSVVAHGCRPIPAAPGGGLLLGHALQLATARCPWEKMLEWAEAKGPLVRFNILQRTGLIVNDPQAAKRIFQVGCAPPLPLRPAGGWRQPPPQPPRVSRIPGRVTSPLPACLPACLPAHPLPALQYAHPPTHPPCPARPADQAAGV